MRFDGQELHMSLDRSLLGLTAGPFAIDFKWTDNFPESWDIMDFYTRGDVAPEGRLVYRYQAQ